MDYNVKAIPTTYQGVNFRSRLEAKWAAFFDQVGWRWEYEPTDRDGWIPDFRLMLGKCNPLVEVKPLACVANGRLFNSFTAEFNREIRTPGSESVLMVGEGIIQKPSIYNNDALGICFFDGGTSEQCLTLCCDFSYFGICSSCKKMTLTISTGFESSTNDGSAICARCGKSGYPGDAVVYEDLRARGWWRQAGNKTQWSARR